MNALIATLNNLPLLTLRVELKRGAEPSSFVATLAKAALPGVGENVDLRLTEGTHARRFAQFHVTQVLDLGDSRIEIRGADAREHWSRTPVNARLNVSYGDGASFEPATINAGTPWNLAQTVSALFAAANEPAGVCCS